MSAACPRRGRLRARRDADRDRRDQRRAARDPARAHVRRHDASPLGRDVDRLGRRRPAARALPRGRVHARSTSTRRALAATDSTYQTDAAYSASQVNQACGTLTAVCTPTQTVTGPDGRSYRVDTYIVWTTPAGGTRREADHRRRAQVRLDGDARPRRLDRRRRLLARSASSRPSQDGLPADTRSVWLRSRTARSTRSEPSRPVRSPRPT